MHCDGPHVRLSPPALLPSRHVQINCDDKTVFEASVASVMNLQFLLKKYGSNNNTKKYSMLKA